MRQHCLSGNVLELACVFHNLVPDPLGDSKVFERFRVFSGQGISDSIDEREGRKAYDRAKFAMPGESTGQTYYCH